MPETLLVTKLHIPRPRRDVVHRPRLMERLEAGLHGKLTLVSAPAGYGKTTLVANWIDLSQTLAAWLSLDKADNDPARFAEAHSPLGETLLSRLVNDIAAATGDPSTASGLAREGREFVLVLENYHLITSQAVHKALKFLLEHLPDAMHLLIMGRSDPPLPVSRLRVQGEITEIRTPDLRFTKAETASFLNDLMGLGLSLGDISALEARTEGWIASLQLAALSLRGRPDKREFVAAFSGSHRYVIDYLVDEVLSRQPDNIQVFLRQTAILDRFCAPLCDAVLDDAPRLKDDSPSSFSLGASSHSQMILEQLERANLFLVPLDAQRRWYRYHHLFADFLAQRLHQREPEHIPNLHRRASGWFEAEGLMDEAIQHALLAQDRQRAARLVDQIAASLVVRRESNKLVMLVNQLAPDWCQDYPMLCVWHAWALLFSGQLDKAESDLLIAEIRHGKVPQFPIPAYVTTIRAYLANQKGNLQEAVDLSQRALEQMSGASDGQITPIFRGAAVIWLGVNYRHLGYLDRAGRLLAKAASLNQKAGNFYGALASMEQLGDLALIQGRLHRAMEIYGQGLEMAQKWSKQEVAGRETLPAATGLYLGLGTVLYQWNDLAGAATHLQRAYDLGELGRFWGRMHCYRMLAYLKHAEGDNQAAYDLLRQACRIRDSLSFRQVNTSAEPGLAQLSFLLSRTRPEMAHLRADIASEMERQDLGPADNVDFARPEDYARESVYSNLARVLFGLGRAWEILPLIDRLLEAAQSMGRQGDAIRYLILRALAFQEQGDTASSLASLRQALILAEPEGYVRIFVDEGEPMAELLQQAASRGFAPDYVARLLAAFAVATKGKGRTTRVDPSSLVVRPSSALVEPLSQRELEVLRLMAAGLKHKEVAEELVISLNTVRHHARNIYGKLNVNSRAQAVAKAKDLNLLQ